MKQPMKKGSFVPKNVPRVGSGGSCRSWVGWVGCHVGVGCGGSCRGRWGGVSCRAGVGPVGWDGVGHVGVGWVM